MKRSLVSILAAVVAASVAIAGCSQAAPPAPTQAPAAPAKPAAAPTQAPAAPAKAAEPAKAAQPTAAPAKKVVFPEKGRVVSVIMPYGPGGATDTLGRILAPLTEKELGITVQIVNRPGAGSQIGMTEMVNSKPDGYTYGHVNLPNPITIALNPDRQATFSRKDFQPLALHVVQPNAIAVKADSQYKTLTDLLNAAKANPGKVRAGTSGLMGDDHLAIIAVERSAGVKFASVHFDSSGEREPALMGGKIDAAFGGVGSFFSLTKQGQIRTIAITDTQEARFAPGVPTTASFGLKATSILTAHTLSGPAGMPKEVLDTLAGALKKAINNPEQLKKMEELGYEVRYMDPDQLGKFWTEQEEIITPLMQQALSERK